MRSAASSCRVLRLVKVHQRHRPFLCADNAWETPAVSRYRTVAFSQQGVRWYISSIPQECPTPNSSLNKRNLSRSARVLSHESGADGASRGANSTPTPPSFASASSEALEGNAINSPQPQAARVSTKTLLERISALTHHLNTLTGTDYTPITRLRSTITSQETKLSTLFSALAEAKAAHTVALNKRTASQKEVVQLLERKHSWSATDLERYMSLIRSEHVDDKAVAEAQDGLQEREKDLEEGRQMLDKLERELYHEEQVWSDTIRRNSTWVTVGLMGLNVGLLVASLVLIEPWRRRRLVSEIRGALDEKVPTGQDALREKEDAEVDEVATLGRASDATLPLTVDAQVELGSGEAPFATLQPAATGVASSDLPAHEPPALLLHEPANGKLGTWELYKAYWADLFSERQIAVRKKDLTANALEGAAAGAALMGLLFVLLRPR